MKKNPAQALPLTIATLVVASAMLSCGAPPFLLGGIQVNEADHERWFEALRDAGMNTVSTTVYAKQGDWDSDNLWWSEEERAVVQELRGARTHGLRTVLIPRVALDHAFDRNEFLWHGLIYPANDALLESWFARYRDYVVKWARIARDQHVDVYAVGSELNAMASTVPVDAVPTLAAYYLDEQQQRARKQTLLARAETLEAHHLQPRGRQAYDSLEAYLDAETVALRSWAATVVGPSAGQAAVETINRRRRRLDVLWRELIAEVRQVYPGRLTYAANFDQYRDVGFWDALDLIGINAYFPLRPPGEPVTADTLYPALRAGWRRVFDDIQSLRAERGLDERVLFTEIGYTRRGDATLAPWSGFGFALLGEGTDRERLLVWDRQPSALEERALALRALHAEHVERGGELLAGLLYWKLTTEPSHLEIEPFVHLLGSPDDPMGDELRRFLNP